MERSLDELYEDSSDVVNFKATLAGEIWGALGYEGTLCSIEAVLDVAMEQEQTTNVESLAKTVKEAIDDIHFNLKPPTLEAIISFVDSALTRTLSSNDFDEEFPEVPEEDLDLTLDPEDSDSSDFANYRTPPFR